MEPKKLFFLCCLLAWASAGCVPAQEGDALQQACNESDLIAQCPPGSSPLLGSAAQSACGGAVGIDLTNEQGAVNGRCLGSAQCIVACQFSAPCPCGVTAVTREGVFCTPCNQTAACGNTLCEGGEDPQSCPEDCGRQCSPGEARCAGDSAQEVCDNRGRWESIACPSGEVCQAIRENQVVCRRDDVLVGVNPGEDPNIEPERAERFVLYVSQIPEMGQAAQDVDATALVWEAGFTVLEPVPRSGGAKLTLALGQDAQSVWFWRNDRPSSRYDLAGEELEALDLSAGDWRLSPRSMGFSLDGSQVLFTEEDTRLEEGRRVFMVGPEGPVELGQSGPYKLVSPGNGDPTVISADGGTGVVLLQNAYTYAPDPRYPNDMLLITTEYAFWRLSLPSGEARKIPGGLAGAQGISVSPNGRVVSAVSISNWRAGTSKVELYDLQEARHLATIEPEPGHVRKMPLHARFSPRGDRLAVRTSEGVELWDPQLGALLATLPTNDSSGEVLWSPDGASLFVGSRRFLADGSALEDLPQPEQERQGMLEGMRFGPQGRLVVWRRVGRSFDGNNTIEVDVYAPAP